MKGCNIMYEWNFSMATLEKGVVSFKVKARDKKSAIDKGFAKIKRMNLTATGHWNCKLVLNF